MKKIIIGVILIMFQQLVIAQTNQPVRLRVGTYNVGHFNQGSLGGFQYPGSHTQAELIRWRKWIGEQGMDFFIVNEWNKQFDRDSTIDAEKELLKPYYNNIYFGDRNTWIYNGIATNYKLSNIRQKYSHGDYYAIMGDLKIAGKTITIISTHIPWQKDWHVPALDSLIADLKKYKYFICLGDINALDAEQLRFVSEGFNMANGGSQGWFTTAPTGALNGKKDGIHIDNIITSGNIKIFNVSVPMTGLNDHDHLPVLADVVITE